MQDLLALLAFPFLAAIVFVGMHTWLGLQVLRRNVVFADLALAQLSALGATAAVATGHAPGSLAGTAYALLAALSGAVLLTLTRRFAGRVSQEAVIGIVYVVATAATVLVVDRSPQGAEHVKRMLVGSLLTIGPQDVLKLTALYGAIGLVHVLLRRPLLAAAHDGPAAGRLATALWDFVFYGSFGLVVTSSVMYAGVLLVFSFLIIPAVIGTMFTARIAAGLIVGWAAGVLATVLGFGVSVLGDLPTGPAMVVAFAAVLCVAVPVRALLTGPRPLRRANFRRAALGTAILACVLAFAQGAWLIAAPDADQPILAALERGVGLGPEQFLTPSERSAFEDAAATERRNRDIVESLRAAERDARWKGEGLSEENLRRIASYQQSYNEMSRGERFVQDHLRAKARARERWYVGLPALGLAGAGLIRIASGLRRRRRNSLPHAIPGR